ncbi:MAG TPA: argininosuccinate synthase [bacterium]|nr:argininosuccinate synthase [bacterium]
MKSKKGEVKKVVLAYSGGLDTSVIVPWLIENYGCEVITYTGNIGQYEELTGLEEKALSSGASKAIVEDLRKEFIEEYIFPTIRAGAMYEQKYLLGTSFARPILAKKQVEAADREGADAVSHGCTGKGNDQVRFELTYKAFNPKLKIISPWREWDIKSREDALEYVAKRNIPVEATAEKIYSTDKNIWHMSHEGGDLENPYNSPNEGMYAMCVSPEKAPDEATIIEIGFEKGYPVSIDGVKYSSVELVEKLNKLAGENGIGVVDMVENRLVGMKSRGIYETPGGTLLYSAHRELESLVMDADTMHFKDSLAPKYAELVYYGKWFTPLREALDAFVDTTQENLTGEVKLKLYKGNCIVMGRKSPFSLYREDFATFGEEDVYDQKDAEGFINLFGLPMKVRSMLEIEGFRKTDYKAPNYSKFKRD